MGERFERERIYVPVADSYLRFEENIQQNCVKQLSFNKYIN